MTSGKAFFSTVYTVSFEWTDPSINLQSVAIKIPKVKKLGENHKVREQQSIEYLEYCHKNEVEMYKFLNISSVKHSIPIKIPKYYYGYEYSRFHNDGILIIDDMSKQSGIVNVLPGLSNGQIESVINELANLHVLGWKENEFVQNKVERKNWESFLKVAGTLAQQIRNVDPTFGPIMDVIEKFYNLNVFHYGLYKGDKYGTFFLQGEQ